MPNNRVNKMLGLSLQWSSIPSRGINVFLGCPTLEVTGAREGTNTSSHFILRNLSWHLAAVGHRARKDSSFILPFLVSLYQEF